MRIDVHTHHYPAEFFRLIERSRSDFSFGTDPTGRRIIRYKGSRFFGITPPMTDVAKRIEDMDRVGIDVAVLSLSTPNVYFAEPAQQPEVARLVNDSYADEIDLMERMDNGWRDFAETKANIDELPSTYLKRLYYDTVSFSQPSLRYVHGLVGADHMLMGSDYPHLLGSIERAVSSIAELDVPQADRDRIFSGTALSILNNVDSVREAVPR